MKIKTIIWQEKGVWCASVPALEGCHTCADTFEELKINIKDAVEGWLDAMNSMDIEILQKIEGKDLFEMAI